MSLVSFDASAFVKLLTTETGSPLASALWDGCDAASSSRPAYPEVRAALTAAARNHDLTQSALAAAERDWEDFWAVTRPVELTTTVEQHAGHLARAMPYAEPTLSRPLTVTKIHTLLARQECVVAYPTLHRFASERCGFGCFGYLGILTDAGDGRRRTVHARDLHRGVFPAHRAKTTIVTSNREPEWPTMTADTLLAQSAIDRLTASAHTVVIEGPSYRQRTRSQLDPHHPCKHPQ